MTKLRGHGLKRLLAGLGFAALLVLPALALAGPRSVGSFGGRGGFRSAPSRSYSTGRSYGGGTNVIVTPGLGWGLGGWGYGPFGYGGGFGLGSLIMVAMVGMATVAVVRAVRRARHPESYGDADEDGEVVAMPSGRAYVYTVQLGLGRSARGIQDRLARFAAEGDTSSEAGLAQLLQQTSVELMREKDSIRYAALAAAGPMSLTNAETKMNAVTLAERSRFQVERVRGADGTVRRSSEAPEEGKEALEYVMVTLVVASRTPIAGTKKLEDRHDVESTLTELGGLAPRSLLGLEVVWTPADGNDSMTETDLLTTYPDLRGV